MQLMTLDTFARWMEAYGRASTDNDPGTSAGLFAVDARYHESPFAEPLHGREAIYAYWRAGAETLTDKESSFEILALQANQGIARWQSCHTVMASGERLALDCLFVVTFGDDGLCQTFREWWHGQRVHAPGDPSRNKDGHDANSKDARHD